MRRARRLDGYDPREATTGEAGAWWAGFVAGHRAATNTLQPLLREARAALAEAEAERDGKPTGMEYRGG